MKLESEIHAMEDAGGKHWESFVSAGTAEERCRGWLDVVCAKAPEATSAAILIESVDARSFVPIAVWPEALPGMERLAPVVEAALRARSGIVQPVADDPGLMQVAYPLMLGNRIDGVVALEARCSAARMTEILRDLHWGSAWLANLLGAKELDEAIRGRDRLSGILETTAIALRHGKFRQAMFELVNELRLRFACSRVALGLVEHAAVRIVALSEAATFEKNTPIVKAYTRAMEEAYDAGKPLWQRAKIDVEQLDENVDAVEDGESSPQHLALLYQSGAAQVLSIPLLQGVECIAVLTLETSAERSFTDADRRWLDGFAAMIAPILVQRQAAEKTSIARISEEWRRLLERLFGPRHLIWKAGASVAFLFVLLMLVLPWNYRVTAKTVVEGEIQRVVAAPFEGFIGSARVRAGDTVKEGELLATLDNRDLLIEQAKWRSERDQYDNRLREAMAKHDLTAVQVIGAQFRQSEAQLALVSEKVERAQLLAPYAGIVVSGDLSQQIGAPVEAGKKLFEIAPLQSYRVILQVDEREIRHVLIGQQGRLVITGIAGDAMSFSVAKVTPVATAQDGKNYFRVEASLDHPAERLRPGMEGIGKVEVGSKRLWWVLTHSFTDWLVLTLWTWMP